MTVYISESLFLLVQLTPSQIGVRLFNKIAGHMQVQKAQKSELYVKNSVISNTFVVFRRLQYPAKRLNGAAKSKQLYEDLVRETLED